jgi:hypothetical protein
MTVILIVVLVVGVGYGFMRYRETIDKTKKGVESYQLQRSGESNRSNQIQRPSGLNPLDAVPPADNSHR